MDKEPKVDTIKIRGSVTVNVPDDWTEEDVKKFKKDIFEGKAFLKDGNGNLMEVTVTGVNN